MKKRQRRERAKETFGVGWVTSDEDERALRRMRATTEKMSLRYLAEDADKPFGAYAVKSVEGRGGKLEKEYRVEIRTLNGFENTCTCPDFRKNGLGTCKHIERAITAIKRNFAVKSVQSPVGEVFVSGVDSHVHFMRGAAMTESAAESVARHFNPQGRMRITSPLALEALLATCELLNRKVPGTVRVSPAVEALAKEKRSRESLAGAVGAFASYMAGKDGAWPFLKLPLFPYQVEGAIHLATKGRAILADEMGLGKTVQAIAAALLLRHVANIRRALIVVPASLKGEWTDQIALFSDAKSEILIGPRADRLMRYKGTDAFFLVANYEQVVRDWREINDRLRPDLVILDEAQRIKNWNTTTAKNLKRLSSRFAFVLTGTPLENRIDEFYSLAEFVEPSLFGSLFRFNRAYYRFDERGKSTGMQNLDDLHDKAATIMLRRRKDMVEDELPERKDKSYFVGLTDEQATRYAEYETKVSRLCSQAKNRPLKKEELDLLQRYLACMRMLCDTCYILDAEVRESPKVDEAVHILEDVFASDPGRKVVVFSEWVRMLELMRQRLSAANIGFAMHTGSIQQDKRREELRRFRTDPGCRVLLSSESGGVGLNLQAASVVMNLDLPWNPAKLEQRIARVWRKRQGRDVLVVNIIAENTIEHKMQSTLKFKQGLADLVLDARGDAADFETEKSRSAFVARVSQLMDDGNAAKAATTAKPPSEPQRNKAQETAAEPQRQGNSATPANVAAPTEERREDPLTPETLALLSRLEKLGLVTLGDEAKKRLADVAATAQNPASTSQEDAAAQRERAEKKRRALASSAFGAARRSAGMADVLSASGFAEESAAPYCKAVALAAGAAMFALSHEAAASPADIPDAVEPIALDALFDVIPALSLQPDDALTLQFAVQNHPIPDATNRVRSFLAHIEKAMPSV